MEKVDTNKARKLYGKILDGVKGVEDVVGSFSLCICRGRCVCHETNEPHKLNIEEIRNYECKESEYKTAA